jgi:hypothetical protein
MVPEHVSRLLAAYVDGELRPRQRRSVERMLLRSQEACALLQSLQQDAAEIGNLPHVVAPRDIGKDVLRKLGRAAVVPALLPFASKRPPAAWFRHTIAASILLGASLGTAVYIATRIVQPGLAYNSEEPELPPPYIPESGVIPESESTSRLPFVEPIPERPSLTGFARPRPPASVLRIQTDVLATPFESTENLKTPIVTVSFMVPLKELHRRQGELRKELSHGQGHRLDVYCTDQFAALAALHSGLKTIGTDLLDRDANAQLGLGLKTKTDVAVFLESVNPNDLTKVLGHLYPDGPKDAARLANGNLMVSDLTTDEGGKLVNLPESGGARPKNIKSLSLKAEMRAIRAASVKSVNPIAVAVAFEPSRLHEFFLPPYSSTDSPGNNRALIILHARK